MLPSLILTEVPDTPTTRVRSCNRLPPYQVGHRLLMSRMYWMITEIKHEVMPTGERFLVYLELHDD